jgi:hypothetical protein
MRTWKGSFLLLIPIGCPLLPRYLIACKLSKLFLLKKMDLQKVNINDYLIANETNPSTQTTPSPTFMSTKPMLITKPPSSSLRVHFSVHMAT